MRGVIGTLERVPIREIFATEDCGFTPWLADNIQILADALNLSLEVEEIEKYVGGFRADIVCRDSSDDRLVLIENQFGRTDHKHLGQLLTYAAGTDAVAVIWIAEQFAEEHRAALDWLNRHTSDDLSFYGVTLEVFRIGQSAPAPKFEIVATPNDWARAVRQQTSTSASKYSEGQQSYLTFWNAFRERFPNSAPRTRQAQRPNDPEVYNFECSPGFVELRGILKNGVDDAMIRIQYRFTGDRGRIVFDKLAADRQQIQSALGEKIEWVSSPSKKRTRAFVEYRVGNICDISSLNDVFSRVEKTVNKMQSVIQSRIDSM